MVETIRAFVAIELPERVRDHIGAVLSRLQRERFGSIRWVRLEGVHLTLKFLGEVPTDALPSIQSVIAQAAGEVSAFQLGISDLGAFPNARTPRVLWIGVTGDLERLTELQRRLEVGFEPLGFPKEGRTFHPHLTLGRVSRPLGPAEQRRLFQDVLPSISKPEGLEIPARAISLMRSTLTPSGAIYTRLAEAPLAK